MTGTVFGSSLIIGLLRKVTLNISFIICNGDETSWIRFNNTRYKMHCKHFKNYTNTSNDDNDKLATILQFWFTEKILQRYTNH